MADEPKTMQERLQLIGFMIGYWSIPLLVFSVPVSYIQHKRGWERALDCVRNKAMENRYLEGNFTPEQAVRFSILDCRK